MSRGSCKSRRFGETSVLTRATRRNIPEDAILHLQALIINRMHKNKTIAYGRASNQMSGASCGLPLYVSGPVSLVLCFGCETDRDIRSYWRAGGMDIVGGFKPSSAFSLLVQGWHYWVQETEQVSTAACLRKASYCMHEWRQAPVAYWRAGGMDMDGGFKPNSAFSLLVQGWHYWVQETEQVSTAACLRKASYCMHEWRQAPVACCKPPCGYK
jgi:hypothetical protein